MSTEGLKQTTTEHKDGNIVFSMIMVDGIGIPPFPPTRDDGFPQRLKDLHKIKYRSDDVLLATYPKCGTHWSGQILTMLTQKKAEYTAVIEPSFMLEAIPDLKDVDEAISPRIMTTHLPYRHFPRNHIENGGKIIHVTRNPKDAYVSMFHHTITSDSFGKQSGLVTWDQYFDIAIRKEVTFYGSWFDYERGMAKAKLCNPNIITIYFEDMKKDFRKEVRNIAEFLGIEARDELVEQIEEKCKFQNIKNAASNITPEAAVKMEEFKKQMNGEDYKMPVVFRKGIIGDWKNHFTVAQNEEFNAMFAEKMKGVDVPVFYES